jgi:uncharacterized membrane protein (Fun14 family)
MVTTLILIAVAVGIVLYLRHIGVVAVDKDGRPLVEGYDR